MTGVQVFFVPRSLQRRVYPMLKRMGSETYQTPVLTSALLPPGCVAIGKSLNLLESYLVSPSAKWV